MNENGVKFFSRVNTRTVVILVQNTCRIDRWFARYLFKYQYRWLGLCSLCLYRDAYQDNACLTSLDGHVYIFFSSSSLASYIFLRPKINRCRLNESLIVVVSMRANERATERTNERTKGEKVYSVVDHLPANKLNTGQRKHDERRGEV